MPSFFFLKKNKLVVYQSYRFLKLQPILIILDVNPNPSVI